MNSARSFWNLGSFSKGAEDGRSEARRQKISPEMIHLLRREVRALASGVEGRGLNWVVGLQGQG